MSAPQFGKLYWDVDASLAVRAVLARVEYRCYAADGFRPTEIIEADFELALGLGRTATKAAIKDAIAMRLIARTRSTRGDGRGVFVYLPLPRPECDPNTVAERPRRVRKRAAARSESDPNGAAEEQPRGRQSNISDPPIEPTEPFVEPTEEPEERSHERDPLTENTTDADQPADHDHRIPVDVALDRRSQRGSGRQRDREDPRSAAGLDASRPGRGHPVPDAATPAVGQVEPLTLAPLFVVEVKPDIALELLAEHDRRRKAALERHGLRVTDLRRPNTKAEAKTLRLVRERLAEHGEDTCRHVLAVLSADWQRDDSQFRPRDWTCEDAIWSTNFDRHRVREVGSTFGKRVESKPGGKRDRFEDAAVWVPPPGTPAPPKREPRIAIPKQREVLPHEEDWK